MTLQVRGLGRSNVSVDCCNNKSDNSFLKNSDTWTGGQDKSIQSKCCLEDYAKVYNENHNDNDNGNDNGNDDKYVCPRRKSKNKNKIKQAK